MVKTKAFIEVMIANAAFAFQRYTSEPVTRMRITNEGKRSKNVGINCRVCWGWGWGWG